MQIATHVKQIAFLGDHLPRQCGIATSTADICDAIESEFPDSQCVVGAVNDRPEGYDYPPRIRFEIDEKELDSYRWRNQTLAGSLTQYSKKRINRRRIFQNTMPGTKLPDGVAIVALVYLAIGY